MARITILLTLLTSAMALLGGFRWLANEWRLWRKKRYLALVLFGACLAAPAHAQVNGGSGTDFIHLPWSTSHIEQATSHNNHADNCKEQDQNDTGGVIWVNCDDMVKGGGQKSGPTYNLPCQITTDANRAEGAGGRGWRAWEEYETTIDGPAPGSAEGPEYICGTPELVLSDDRSTLREIWMRFYLRFESGWTRYTDQTIGQWDGMKLIYWGSCDDGSGGYFGYTNGSCHENGVNGTFGSRNFYVALNGYDVHLTVGNGDGSGQTVIAQNVTSDPIKEFGGGSATSDGRWVCIQVHWKADSVADSSNDGEFHLKMNGTTYLSKTDINWRIGTNNNLVFTKGATPGNGLKWEADPILRYFDFDDWAISNTGEIACDAAASPSIALFLTEVAGAATVGLHTLFMAGYFWQQRTKAVQASIKFWQYVTDIPTPKQMFWAYRYKQAVKRWQKAAPLMLPAPTQTIEMPQAQKEEAV